MWNKRVVALPVDKGFRLIHRKTHKEFNINKKLIEYIDGKNDSQLSAAEDAIKKLRAEKFLVAEQGTDLSLLTIESFGTNSINTLQIEITSCCNLKCKHCYQDMFTEKHMMSLDDFKRIVYEAKRSGVYKICITGGEPFVHPEIKEFIEFLNEMNMVWELFTNGVLLGFKELDLLEKNSVSLVKISLDGFNTRTYNAVRDSKYTFGEIFNIIKELQKRNLPVKINTMLHKQLLNELNNLEKFMMKNNLNYSLDRIVDFSGNSCCQELLISREEYTDAIVERLKEESILNVSAAKKDYCGYGSSFLYITATGLAKLCPSFPDNFNVGNILESGYDQILDNFKRSALRKAQCHKIDSCLWADICSGGCRNKAYWEKEGLNDPDLDMCCVMEKLHSS